MALVGFQVRDEELDKPFKLVKKRKQPARRDAGGGGGGGGFWARRGRMSTGLFGGGRGWGGGGGRGGGEGANGAEEEEEEDDAGPEPLGAEAGGGGGGAGAAAAAAGEGGEGMTKLYGKWQADPHVPRAVDGKVPRNERGNVEVPPCAAVMPIGCVHLKDLPGLAAICR